ncbi:oligosaccharide flippase family protein [Bacillus horti]|uniref:oligosaccharide flippase family protein n=1 Tax=Caldalkalibacillus horti TaxID=77523 RepID=UPI0027D81094|nr:oligosaccharide flippase family protein [Bacillus horti]
MFKKNKVLRHISVLLSGSVIAQLLTFLMAPILSRLFAPEAFGIFALYTSLTTILSVIVTWKYELAIVLPKSERQAANLYSLSVFITVMMSVGTLVVLFLFGETLASIFRAPELKQLIYLLPISLLALGVYQSSNFWSTRKKAYNRISISQIIRSGGVNATQVGSGLIQPGAYGLIGGQIVGQMLAAVVLSYQVLREDWAKLKSQVTKKEMLEGLREYKDFPLYSSSQAFVNAISQNMMPFLLTYFFQATIVGYYALALRLIQMPLDLLGNAVKQVFYQRASEMLNQSLSISRFYLRSTAALAGIAFLPALVLILYAPELFKWILGTEWTEAGIYASWMIVGLFFWFVARPAVSLFQILRLQGFFFVFEATSLVIKLGGLLYIAFQGSALYTVIGFSILHFIHYTLIIFIGFRILRHR